MRIGIIGAMDMETASLRDMMDSARVRTISSVSFFSGMIRGAEVVTATAGVGKVNAAVAAQTMILEYKPDYVVNIGVAGGLHSGFHIGDIAVAQAVVEHDMDTTAVGDPAGFISGLNTVFIKCDRRLSGIMADAARRRGINTISGVIASGDRFIADDESRRKIIRDFGAIAAEMEGAAVGHVCAMNGVGFGVMRAISDGADGGAHMDYPTFAKAAAENSVKIAADIIEQLQRSE